MNRKYPLTPGSWALEDISLAGPVHPVAAVICLFGFFLHIVLSDPLLNSVGFHYSAVEGSFYEKIHPGTLFIFISFFVLLWSGGNPLRKFMQISKEQPVCLALLGITVIVSAYMLFRSGAAGLAFMIDTHMTVPLCAIVLSYAPLSMCRRAVHFFISVACINGLIGIAESIGKIRIFTFDPEWGVLKEDYFRASALRGHPLNNAMFTSIALFVVIAQRLSLLPKTLLILILTVSLVSFGGRIGLATSVLGLAVLGGIGAYRALTSGRLSMLKTLLLGCAVIVVPLGFVALIGASLMSSMGERLMASSLGDASVESRGLALMAFHYMSSQEMLFGVSTARIIDIAYRLGLVVPLSDIENPWLLMFMYMGAIFFPLWFIATAAFNLTLMRGKALALQFAVCSYFIVASTSNSFGRKDSTYLIMVCAVMCGARALMIPNRGASNHSLRSRG